MARPPPRGRKAWGLLAYLVCGEPRPSRQHLAGLLFAEADDPLGSLRWNLAQLRRTLGPGLLPEKTLELELPAGAFVDVHALTQAPPLEAVAVPGLGRELLEGMDFGSSPAFEAWLLLERRSLIGAAEAALREAALGQLASGEPRAATQLAARLVRLNAYDENFQELLIRCYREAGDRGAAVRQRQACVELFRRELGRDPSQAVFRAAGPPATTVASQAPPTGAEAARARLEAGRSAVDAGALDAGLQALELAVGEAQAGRDSSLEARAHLALGTALIHAARGRDEEGAASLERAVRLSSSTGHRATAAAALRELGYVEVLRGRYGRCLPRLRRAAAFADSSEERAGVEAMLGMAAGDIGMHDLALTHLSRSIELAEATESVKQLCYSLSFLGRSHLLREEWEEASRILARSLAAAERDWITFVPWPESLLAEVELRTGAVDAAMRRFEHAHALGCQLGDPCWEAMAGRGRGLAAAAQGDVDGGRARLEEARRRAASTPDAYVWAEAYVLDAMCELAARHLPGQLRGWSVELEALAGRTGMRELNARAYLARATAGDAKAAEVARMLAGKVQNPRLRDRAEAALGTAA